MDADHGLHTAPVIPPLPFEALLSESQRLQALSLQLIRESRELRTICSLIQHRYGHHHRTALTVSPGAGVLAAPGWPPGE